CGEVTASSLSFPSAANGATEPAGMTAICTSPRNKAVTAAGDPGNGRGTRLTPALRAHAALARGDSEPLPTAPYVYLSGARLMAWSRLSTPSAATPGLSTRTLGCEAKIEIGAMSFSVS